jgi:predicted RecA/RadA family phage recombinase
MSNTYTLKSAAWIYTPSMVALAIDQFATNPKWSVKLLREGFHLPAKVAKGLASGAISYEVKDESVIFTA